MMPTAAAPIVDRRTRRLLGSYALSAVGAGLPWPLLMVLAWEQTHDETAVALTGAARMLPYVLLSWWTGRLADRFPRARVIRLTLLLRLLLALAALAFLVAGGLVGAVVACTLVVAAGTPTYPAVAAALPAQTKDLRAATTCLVTIEAAGFVVGPAIGGLLLHEGVRWVVPVLTVATGLGALVVFGRTRLAHGVAGSADRDDEHVGVLRLVLRHPGVRRAVVLMCLVNVADGLVGVALVPLSEEGWHGTAAAYGLATALLGFGALGAPVLAMAADGPRGQARLGILVCAAGLAAVAPTTAVGWALAPLAVAGAASVVVESAATEMLQEQVPDRLRASVLGLTDTLIVTGALAGALAAPLVVTLAGPRGAMGVVSVVAAAGLLATRPRGESASPAGTAPRPVPADATPTTR